MNLMHRKHLRHFIDRNETVFVRVDQVEDKPKAHSTIVDDGVR
jgi:hypothetical protein